MNTVTVPANYKPTEKEKYLNPVMLEYFRQKLLHWKTEIVHESELDVLHRRTGRYGDAERVARNQPLRVQRAVDRVDHHAHRAG